MPEGFAGDFEVEVRSGGELTIPPGWNRASRICQVLRSPIASDQCLLVFETTDWVETEAVIRSFGTPVPADVRSLQIEQGGILRLPVDLLEAVGIEDLAVLNGVWSWFGVWRPSTWAEMTAPKAGGKVFWR